MSRPPWEDHEPRERPRETEAEAIERAVNRLAYREDISKKEAAKRKFGGENDAA